MALAAALTVPPSNSIASDFFMSELNHDSSNKATMIAFRPWTFASMIDYASRLEAAMKQAGLKTQGLADALGITYQAVARVLDGKTKAFTADNNSRAARALGVQTDWLATGEGTMTVAEEASNVTPGPEIKKHEGYPLISWVQAGDWTGNCESIQPGEYERLVPSHHNLGKCGYVLRVMGNSMTGAPGDRFSFPEGILLYVNPDKEAVAGQFVIVRREKDKAAMFKRLAMVDGELFLKAINPEWPKQYTKLEDGDEICGVVVDASFGNLP